MKLRAILSVLPGDTLGEEATILPETEEDGMLLAKFLEALGNSGRSLSEDLKRAIDAINAP